MTSKGTHTIVKLKGTENYDTWKEELQDLLTLDQLWLVVSGRETSPTRPKGEATPKELEIYYEKKLNFDDKNARAVAVIRLSCESGPKIHIKDTQEAPAVWRELEKQYGATDLATLDLAIQSICGARQVDFTSVEHYGQHVKQHAAKCSEMGLIIPDWLLGSIFRMGLPESLEPYMFHLTQAARSANRTPAIDEMITTLMNHDKRHQQKKKNHKSLRIKEKASGSRLNSELCQHCAKPDHKEEDCWTKYPDKAPGWVKEKAKWKNSGAKVVRSM